MTKLLIQNIKISLQESESIAISKAKKIVSQEGINSSAFSYSIFKKSIDARDKKNILLVYSVIAETNSALKLKSSSKLKLITEEEIAPSYGNEVISNQPVVVGMGPAGMFCALLLAEHGFNPIIIDRGDCVNDRVIAMERFAQSGILDTESNVQYGAGGAGTFSDGKLTTRINDSKCSYVLRRFVEFGAPDEILTKAKPHIGTDILRNVVNNILSKIEELGGTVIYRCRMDELRINNNSIEVITTKGNFVTDALVLAIGHSARDTYRMLLSKNFTIEPKPFSVGVRVEHLREDIDRALYGDFAGDPRLGAGEYNLSDTKGDRGVYTFCMCPGGEVVPATSQELGVCVNGMSLHARDGRNSNCAVNVSVNTEDFGHDPVMGIVFQEELEKKAYIAGGGDYFAPIQLMGDFLEGKVQHSPSRIIPTYGAGNRTTVTDLSAVLPDFVTKRLREGFTIFDKKINGFAACDAVITAVETRTSAPLRIMRNETMQSISNPNIYPCGEGAGYAGGIMSSAVDGIKVALNIMNKYKPN